MDISKIFLDTKDEIVKGYRFKPTFISSKLNNILITKGFESIKIGVYLACDFDRSKEFYELFHISPPSP